VFRNPDSVNSFGFIFLPFTIQHGSPAITAGLPISPV